MNRSDSIANLAAALAKAQAEFPAIPRSKAVKVTSQRGSYTFNYAPFEEILRATKEARKKHGLAFTQSATNDGMETVILHETGEWIASTVPMQIQQAGMQGMGSALTYASRYGFCKAFGIQADDDDDGNAAEGNIVDDAAPQQRNGVAEIKQAEFDKLDDDQKLFVARLAKAVRDLVMASNIAEAVARIDREIPQEGENRLEYAAELKVALWGLLDSKTRSALTKYRNSLKEAA